MDIWVPEVVELQYVLCDFYICKYCAMGPLARKSSLFHSAFKSGLELTIRYQEPRSPPPFFLSFQMSFFLFSFFFFGFCYFFCYFLRDVWNTSYHANMKFEPDTYDQIIIRLVNCLREHKPQRME